MGKLAIPEHILNNLASSLDPNFDKMKLHAEIGADLLSSVKFSAIPVVADRWPPSRTMETGEGIPLELQGLTFHGRSNTCSCGLLRRVDFAIDPTVRDSPLRKPCDHPSGRGSQYDPLVVDTFEPPIRKSRRTRNQGLVAEATGLMRIFRRL